MLYPVTTIGSWPRPDWLLEARRKKHPDLRGIERQATLLAIKYQEDAGLDIIADGEQRRDNFFSFVADRLEGVRLMSMAELLDYVDDKAAFEAMLNALDVPAFAIRNPIVVDKISVREPLALEDARFLREHTSRRVKVTLPGPYLLSRSTWVQKLSQGAYETRELMADRFVEILHDELRELAAMGVDVVQFDEPVLTEIILAGKSKTHTFM
jgi:5-methyltetrahydropteroyltriglutamate--homocysteine methyltransferase